MSGGALRSPEPLAATHDVKEFENGRHASLDEWLRRRAWPGEGVSARTYVVCPIGQPNRVVAHHAIATAAAQRVLLPSAKLRKGMPDEIPLMLIARLAVDRSWQGKGLGSMLLADALRRCLGVSHIAGVRGVIAHAIDDAAAEFYAAHGFMRAPLPERVMIMPMETVAAYLGD
jgi:GNAT superfamily N-acetyltransferase